MEALGKHAPFLLLICLPVAAGWFMLEMACLQLVLSILCFCEESDLQIVELCHSPVRFSCHQGLFRFPEVGGRRGGLESLTSSYVTRHREETLPLRAAEAAATYPSVCLSTCQGPTIPCLCCSPLALLAVCDSP